MAKGKNYQVSANGFTLVDQEGNVRGGLQTDSRHGMPYFYLMDKESRMRVSIHVHPDGSPGMSLLRADGSVGVGMGVDEESTSGIAVYHPNGRRAVDICIDSAGNIDLKVYAADGACIYKFDSPTTDE